MAADYRVSKRSKKIFREDTDARLTSDAQRKNNTRYLYFRKIATGGKCLIQSCRDLHLGRVVCYKTLRPEFHDNPDEQTLFLREARVTSQLQHPNTAPVYEVGYDAHGHYYFTMKLVSGETLREVLDGLSANDPKYTESWDLERLLDVIIQVGQVLSYAHNLGVVHCDVKPENIVTGAFGEVLLLDWGLAHVDLRDPPPEQPEAESENSLHSRKSLEGTPLYMSPEQIQGTNVDGRTDIYSLGAVLFEVLTLQQMAWGNSLDEVLRNKMNGNPPTPSLVAPDRKIPMGLETLYFRCVQRDPNQRIRSTLQLIHELIYWLRTEARHRPV
ncbi:MAG: serine/threonine-protein kinase [Fuerstiella sp.]